MKETYPFTLKKLPYSYNAMEPYIDSKTMMLHHDGHLKAYNDNLNKALENYPKLHNYTLVELLKKIENIPFEIQEKVKNNGGGVYNHNLYFDGLNNVGNRNAPKGSLADKINEQFVSFDNLYNELKKSALDLFGSGFTWLALNNENNLEIINTKNQDTILNLNVCPIILIDVWEHAYYLKYNNKRGDYIDNFKNIIDFDKANKRYLKCVSEIK